MGLLLLGKGGQSCIGPLLALKFMLTSVLAQWESQRNFFSVEDLQPLGESSIVVLAVVCHLHGKILMIHSQTMNKHISPS